MGVLTPGGTATSSSACKHSSLMLTPFPSTKTDSHLSLHDQHRLSARAALLLLPAHPPSCFMLFPVTASLCCSTQQRSPATQRSLIPATSHTSKSANSFLAQVAIRKSSGINVTLLLFSPLSSWSKHPSAHQDAAHLPWFGQERAFGWQVDGYVSPSTGKGTLAAPPRQGSARNKGRVLGRRN